MILDSESWMNVRRFRALFEPGASYAEIAAACGVDWRTAKKYLRQPVGATPPAATSRKSTQLRVIDPFTGVVDAMLRRDIRIPAAVIHERLVAEHGFAHSDQRVKLYVAEARPRIAAQLGEQEEDPMAGPHRRFEVTPGAVGGVSTHMALDLLDADLGTELIMLVAKPAAPAVADEIGEHIAKPRTPVVPAVLDPVWVLRDEVHGTSSWCTLNEGLGRVLRYGAYSDDVIERLVSTLARNGTEFGVQTAGTGARWFTGPAGMIDGLYLGAYGPADANPDIGDSAITETVGLGGFAMAGAPAIVRFVGGSVGDATRTTGLMYEITLSANPSYALPTLDFRGVPTGVDVTRIVRTGILPQINSGIAGRVPGTGQVGAGLVTPPMECFVAALRALATEAADLPPVAG